MKKLLAVCTTALQALGLARGGNSTPRHAHKRVRITKPLAVLTTALLATGLAVVGVAAPASAHIKSVKDTCSTLTVDLTVYQPGSAGSPAVAEVSHMEYKYESTKGSGWNKQTDTTNWLLQAPAPKGNGWSAWVQVDQKKKIDVPAKDAVAATTNHVTVTIDGATPLGGDTDFTTTYQKVFTFSNSTSVHSWNVTVTAWDTTKDHNYNLNQSGSSTPCVTPAVPTFTSPICVNGAPGNGTFTIPTTSGVTYKYQIESGQWNVGTAGNSPYALPLNKTVHIKASQSGSTPIVGFAGPWDFTATPPVGGCVLTAPTPVPTFTTACGINQGTYTVPANGDHYKYTTVDGRVAGVGTVTVTLSATDGYVFKPGTQLVWSQLYANNDCPLVVPTPKPSFTDLCGIDQGTYTVPADGQHYSYKTVDSRVNGVGTVTVTLVPEVGYAFPKDTQLVWSQVFTNEDCPLVVPTPKPSFTDVCGLGQGTYTVPENGDHYSYTTVDGRTGGVGTVTVTLVPEAGYAFPKDAQLVWSHSYVANDCPLVAPPTEPAFTDLCGLGQDGFTVPADGQNYKFVTVDGRTDGVGTVTVTLVPDLGFAFPKDTTVSWSKTFTNADCPVFIETDPEVVQPQCVDVEGGTTLVSGYITVAVTPHVTYSITGTTSKNDTVNLTNVGAKTDLAPGHYTVTAAADDGFVLAGQHVGPWPLTVSAFVGNCQLQTFGPIPTGVTSTNQVCTAGNATGGTITVGHVDDADFFNIGIDYFINGKKVTSQTTTVPAGTYTVTAVADPNGDASIQDGDLSSWTITVAAPSTDCAQLKTLAFTGADGSMGGMLIFALFLLLGGAGVYTASRFRSRES